MWQVFISLMSKKIQWIIVNNKWFKSKDFMGFNEVSLKKFLNFSFVVV
jgi:hypothetical protein